MKQKTQLFYCLSLLITCISKSRIIQHLNAVNQCGSCLQGWYHRLFANAETPGYQLVEKTVFMNSPLRRLIIYVSSLIHILSKEN